MASVAPRKNKQGDIISYQIKVTRGRDKLTGKQLTPFTMTYTPPEGWSQKAIDRDLQKVMGEFEAACNRGEILTREQVKERAAADRDLAERVRYEEERKPTFSQYVEVFKRQKTAVFAPGTMENYNVALNRADTVFGNMKMTDIDTYTVKQYFADLQINGKNEKNGNPLAHKTVLKHYIVLHAFFESAVEDEIMPYNPMQKMKRPKPRKDELPKKAIVYDEAQVQYIMKCLNKEPLKWKALVMFMIDSGCRRGETVGLMWSEIDFKTGRCNICRNAQYTAGRGTYICTTKSRKNRVIYLNRPVLAILEDWKKQQAIQCLKLGIPQNGYCFTQENGEMMNPQAPTAYLARFGKTYNLPGIHPHALRHTMATISIANGADVVSVSEKLGHAEPSITLNVYTHANEEAKRRSAEILANALYQNA
jgi:integrase